MFCLPLVVTQAHGTPVVALQSEVWSDLSDCDGQQPLFPPWVWCIFSMSRRAWEPDLQAPRY